MDKIFNNILEIVIGVVFLTAFAVTVMNATSTSAANATGHNEAAGSAYGASGTASVFWGIISLLYPILGVGLMIDGLKKFMHK